MSEIAVFDSATADKVLEAARKVLREPSGIGPQSPDSREVTSLLIVSLDSVISGSPGKYNGTAYLVEVSPATGAVAMTQLKRSTNSGTPCEVWNLAEQGVTAHKITTFTPTVISLGTWIGRNTSTNKDIYAVTVNVGGITPGIQKGQVYQMLTAATAGWDLSRAVS